MRTENLRMDEASGQRERRHLHFDFQSQRIFTIKEVCVKVKKTQQILLVYLSLLQWNCCWMPKSSVRAHLGIILSSREVCLCHL